MDGERWLNLQLVDSTGEVLSDRECTVGFAGHDEQVLRLDRAGRLSVVVPAGATQATLIVATRRFDLALALPDASTVAGAQERLNHLNFFAGRVDGDLGPRTAAALRSFQAQHALTETGTLDGATVGRLRSEHGS